MTLRKLLASTLETFLTLLAIFLAHRVLAFGPLAATVVLTPLQTAQAALVGALGDVWVSTLGALLILGVCAVCALALGLFWARVLRVTLLVLFGIGVAGHQSYVEFFQFQLIPFHLRYLWDPAFVAANGSSVLSLKPLAVFATALAALVALWMADLFREARTGRLLIYISTLALLALLAHNRNIHWRVQWFVPENLQVNYLERLYLHYKAMKLPDPLTPEERRFLAGKMGVPENAGLELLLTRRADDGDGLRPVAGALKLAFDKAVRERKRPLVMMVLLESLRPSETGYFAPDKPTLTPRLDEIARHGIVFSRAYSTGSVTRGAQEAVFCGYPGSRDTSLMRGQALAPVTCLPDAAGKSGRGETFWYHGGEARFDNQLSFWSGRGVKDHLSLADFPSNAARTGWGVGDATMFREAFTRLTRPTEADYLLGMVLSVTNHIPWTLPDDKPASFSPPSNPAHPSYVTTAYTDAALGEFLQSLRTADLWSRALIIIASDHGNNLPPYADLYGASPHRARFLQSHVNFLVTGGLTDAALAAEGHSSLALDDVVSQADAAALAAYVIGLPGARFMAENPLRQDRTLPVLATLEEEVFDAVDLRAFRGKELTGKLPDGLTGGEKTALLYYRAFLQYLNEAVKPAAAAPSAPSSPPPG